MSKTIDKATFKFWKKEVNKPMSKRAVKELHKKMQKLWGELKKCPPHYLIAVRNKQKRKRAPNV